MEKEDKGKIINKCSKCWAYYTGKHKCFGLMRFLVNRYKKKIKEQI